MLACAQDSCNDLDGPSHNFWQRAANHAYLKHKNWNPSIFWLLFTICRINPLLKPIETLAVRMGLMMVIDHSKLPSTGTQKWFNLVVNVDIWVYFKSSNKVHIRWRTTEVLRIDCRSCMHSTCIPNSSTQTDTSTLIIKSMHIKSTEIWNG